MCAKSFCVADTCAREYVLRVALSPTSQCVFTLHLSSFFTQPLSHFPPDGSLFSPIPAMPVSKILITSDSRHAQSHAHCSQSLRHCIPPSRYPYGPITLKVSFLGDASPFRLPSHSCMHMPSPILSQTPAFMGICLPSDI